MITPKRRSDTKKRSDLFNYYAAFSYAFVERVFSSLSISKTMVVLDPWNGRGTTTSIGSQLGFKTIGFDLNPAMVAIARAGLVSSSTLEGALDVLRKKRPSNATEEEPPINALLGWLTPSSVRDFSKIRRLLLVDNFGLKFPTNMSVSNVVEEKRRLQDVLFLALATTLRKILLPLRSSNPTWIRERVKPSHRLRPSFKLIWETTIDIVEASLKKIPRIEAVDSDMEEIAIADSRTLPLKKGAIDVVIASPPYCTRIDYAVATRPELAIICDPKVDVFRSLRNSLIGTTSIILNKGYVPLREWGGTCVKTLRAIKGHPSKASGTYYYKNLLQYFDGLYESLRELDRVTKSSAVFAFVVQDSFYKDIHIDLPEIFIEMASSFGWSLTDRENNIQSTTLAASNPRARVYRTNFSAVEAVLFFRKSAL